MLEVEIVNSGSDFIEIRTNHKGIQLKEGAYLEVTLLLHEGVRGDREYSRDTFDPPFQSILLQPLPEKSMFKVSVVLKNGDKQFKASIYTFTKSKISEMNDDAEFFDYGRQ